MRKLLGICVFIIHTISYSQNIPTCLNASSNNIVNFSTPTTFLNMTVGDFNNDGKNDIVTLDGGVKVLLANATGSFVATSSFTVFNGAIGVTSADYNKDGNLDLAISGNSAVNVFYGNGIGAFSLPNIYYSVGVNINSIISSDINNDTNVDIIALGSGNVNVLYGSNTGTFAIVTSTLVAGDEFISEDFNNDGRNDFALVNKNANIVNVLLTQNNGLIGTIVSYSVGVYPTSIASADFNNDGIKDLVTCNRNSKDISVLVGTASGTFLPPTTYTTSGLTFTKVEAIDINNDLKQDIIALDYSNGNIYVFYGNGNGLFNTHVIYSLNMPISILSFDANNDGKKDLFLRYSTSSIFSVIYASNLGINLPYSINSVNGISDMKSIDFDFDSKLDLVLLTYNQIKLLKGDGLGKFTDFAAYSVGNGAQNLIIADFNNDTNIDFATVNSSTNNVSILFGNNVGLFSQAINYSTGDTNPNSIAAADFNGDNFIDIAISHYTNSNIRFLMGNATGSFTLSPYVSWWAGANPLSIVAKDLNNDGNMDVIFGGDNYNAADIGILYGNGLGGFSLGSMTNFGSYTKSVIVEDFNIDGTLDVASITPNNLTVFNNSYGIITTSLIKAVDINHDGFLDIVGAANTTDKLIVLFNNGQGGFINTTNLWGGNNPTSFTSGDFNNDGSQDLITGNLGSSSITVLLNAVPNLTVTGLDSLCLGNGADLIVSGATSYSWSSGSQSNIASVTPTITTTYSVTGINQYGCSNIKNKKVKVNNFPLPTVSVNSGSVCFGDSFLITPNGANTYSFSNGNATITPSVSSSYTILGFNTLGCYGSAISTISVMPLPTITVNSGSICVGNSYTFVPSGALTYTYSSGSAVVSPTANTTYSVVGTSSLGCISSNTAVGSVSTGATPSLYVIGTNSVCAGSSASCAVSGANSYTWSTGATTNSITETPTLTTTYTVTGTDLNNCVGTSTTQILVNPNPTVTIVSSTNSVCIGTSAGITVNGANTYTWSTGVTTNSITETPTITTIYSVTGTDLNNCSNTQTVSVTVDNTCQDVWPGDANSDGTADNLDVLELGLHYTQTGAARASTSNAWQSYFANNWAGTITNGKNLNHSDCNGDGTINDNDTLAIYNNYGLTHAFRATETTTVNPQISIIPDQNYVNKGNWGTASIYLGESTSPINNVNGLAFTLNYDNALIETNSIYIEYQNSFIGLSNQNLKFRKTDFTDGKIYTAITHTVNNNASGYGKIATLHYQIKSTLTSDEVLNLSLTQANQSNTSGSITPLSAGSATLTAVGVSVGLMEFLNRNYVSINPNPTNGNIVITSSNDIEKVEVTNLTGQVLVSETANNKTHQLNLEAFANGVYFVKVYNTQKQVSIKKLVVQR